ncbi:MULTISPECIES: hypothetical protein [unclassified Bradyrhizobium]
MEELKHHDFIDYVDDLVAIQPVQWLLNGFIIQRPTEREAL